IPETTTPPEPQKYLNTIVQPIHSTTVKDMMPLLEREALPEHTRQLHEFFGKMITELAGDIPIHIVDRRSMNDLLQAGGSNTNAPAFYTYQPAEGASTGRIFVSK